MRAALWLLALFGVAVAAALFAGNNQGTVTLYWPPYRIDLSLNLVVLLLVSVTLATGLSWFAVMERIGQGVLALPGLFRRVRGKAVEQHQVRVLREEREEVRKEDAVKRARREPVHIEPPPAPVIEKSDRAKREQQIPLFHLVLA